MNVALLREVCGSIHDWWCITPQQLNELCRPVLGHRNDGWVRKTYDLSTVARIKYGAEGGTLAKELWSLSSIAQFIKGTEVGSTVKAVTFYHVRFENIHPLHDGNGRIGRIIMAGQFLQAGIMAPAMFEQQMVRHQKEYREAFAASSSLETFSRLLVLLEKLTSVRIGTSSLDPSFSLQPLHVPPGLPARVKA